MSSQSSKSPPLLKLILYLMSTPNTVRYTKFGTLRVKHSMARACEQCRPSCLVSVVCPTGVGQP